MFEYIGLLFSSVWELYQIPFPGFSFSIGSVAVGALVAVVSLKMLGLLTGMSFDGFGIGTTLSGYGKGWRLNQMKISAERRNDRINNFNRKGS